MRSPMLQSDLRLDEAQVLRCSPAWMPTPAQGSFWSVVGALESDEFIRQHMLIQQAWGKACVPVCEALPGLHHFNVLSAFGGVGLVFEPFGFAFFARCDVRCSRHAGFCADVRCSRHAGSVAAHCSKLQCSRRPDRHVGHPLVLVSRRQSGHKHLSSTHAKKICSAVCEGMFLRAIAQQKASRRGRPCQ